MSERLECLLWENLLRPLKIKEKGDELNTNMSRMLLYAPKKEKGDTY